MNSSEQTRKAHYAVDVKRNMPSKSAEVIDMGAKRHIMEVAHSWARFPARPRGGYFPYRRVVIPTALRAGQVRGVRVGKTGKEDVCLRLCPADALNLDFAHDPHRYVRPTYNPAAVDLAVVPLRTVPGMGVEAFSQEALASASLSHSARLPLLRRPAPWSLRPRGGE